jgi:hypothetical protein
MKTDKIYLPVFHDEHLGRNRPRSLDYEEPIREEEWMHPVPQHRVQPVGNCNEDLFAFNLAVRLRR